MKKLFTLCIAMLLVLSTVFGGFVGCGRGEEEDFDETKSHLYFGYYDAGYGTDWVTDLKARFEAEFATHSFEEGLTGVQVHPMAIADGQTFLNQIANSGVEVFMTGNSDYYKYVNMGLLLNIDDVVTADLSRYNETKTIESRMDAANKDFYQTDNGYYGLPFVTSNWGIIMNVDLFESKELYFAKGGCPSEYLRTNANCDPALDGEWDNSMYEFTGTGEKSAGPDGKYGTNDDGQPATYEEFFRFCERCYDLDILAFHWAGAHPTQVSKMMIPMVADYEGYEQMSLNYAFNGKAKDLIDVDEQGNVTELDDVDINNSNGYLLAKQEGKYRVLKFWDELFQKTDYYDTSVTLNSSAHKHTDAQDDFVCGGIMEGKGEIALLLDGDWWWNEAQPAFDVVKKITEGEKTANNMRFEPLAFPKATNDKVGEDKISLVGTNSICGINSKIAQNKIVMAKEFVKFAFTNESNLMFTKTTSCARVFEYDFPDGYLDGLNHFARKLIENYNDSVKCPEGSTNFMYISNSFNLFNSEIFWGSVIDGKDTSGIPTFILAKKGQLLTGVDITAEQYFTGMSAFKTKDYWDTRYEKFYD